MPYAATVYKVMIASPGDVQQERDIIREVVAEWNAIHSEERGVVLLPVGWETHSHPEVSGRPQEAINRQVLAGCDLLVAAFWTRLGSPTGKAASGTVEEIEEHIAAGKPAMLYFSSAPVRLDSVDQEQYDALTGFKKECYKRALVEGYGSTDEFREKVRRQLAQAVIRSGWGVNSPGTGRQEPEVVEVDPVGMLSERARGLIAAAAADGNGRGMALPHLSGYIVRVGGRDLYNGNDGRETAVWKNTLKELTLSGLISMIGDKTFELTAAGWAAADSLKSETPGTP